MYVYKIGRICFFVCDYGSYTIDKDHTNIWISIIPLPEGYRPIKDFYFTNYNGDLRLFINNKTGELMMSSTTAKTVSVVSSATFITNT